MSYKSTCLALGLLSLLILTGSPVTRSESYLGPAHPVDSVFFGMHVHRAADGTPWPPVPFASWRLWDTRVTWPEIEPQRGSWNFSLLDRYVELASEHHVDVLLTLGLTPGWASARPHEKSAYYTGNASAPRQMDYWQTYVRAVATRYKGVIHNYELWNEPNLKGTFTGSPADMIDLSRTAFATLKSVDASAVVVSPSPTASEGVEWLGRYLQLGGCRYADVIGYHFYVTPDPPEKMIALIAKVKTMLREHNCNKPLWNTESGWAEPKQFSSEKEAAGYMMRAYILNWLLGVQRCYWYAWDNYNWSTLDLTSRDASRMNRAGAAYNVLHGWVYGAVLRTCERQRSGLWICELQRANSITRLLWSDEGTRSFALPASWHATAVTDWTGRASGATAQITVSDAPILLSGN